MNTLSPIETGDGKIGYARSVRLKSISHNRQPDTAIEPIEEQILPPLLLVFLARSDAPEPAARWVIV
jgi:hypothetical protein